MFMVCVLVQGAYFGITLDLPKYSGQPGVMDKWWREIRQTLVQLKLPASSYSAVVMDLLQGDAKDEFWQRVGSLKLDEEALTPDNVNTVIRSLIDLFDAGQHVMLLLRWRSLLQLKGEPALKFRTRYMRIINALGTYGWSLNDEQKVADFGCRMINWGRIAPMRPSDLDAVLAAVASLGVDTGSEGKAPMPNLMAINEADARNDMSAVSSLMYMGSHASRDAKRQSSARTIKCYNCQKPHHWRECPDPIVFKCFTCGSTDHLKNECPKRKPGNAN